MRSKHTKCYKPMSFFESNTTRQCATLRRTSSSSGKQTHKLHIINNSCKHVTSFISLYVTCLLGVPAGSPSRGGDVMVYVFDINQPSLPTTFSSLPVSISVFMALSTVFHSINFPDNSPLCHSVLPVFSLPYWSFQLYISL